MTWQVISFTEKQPIGLKESISSFSNAPNKTFRPSDCFAQFEESKGLKLEQLLEKFAGLRLRNLEYLKSLKLDETALDKPEFT
jgi:hypothetical protein